MAFSFIDDRKILALKSRRAKLAGFVSPVDIVTVCVDPVQPHVLTCSLNAALTPCIRSTAACNFCIILGSPSSPTEDLRGMTEINIDLTLRNDYGQKRGDDKFGVACFENRSRQRGSALTHPRLAFNCSFPSLGVWVFSSSQLTIHNTSAGIKRR